MTRCCSSAVVFAAVPYDLCCSSVQKILRDKTCKTCYLQFISLVMVRDHMGGGTFFKVREGTSVRQKHYKKSCGFNWQL